MGKIISLSEMQPGQRARITELTASGSIRRRLLDIGLVEGTEIKCVGKSPAGDPAAFYIRGAVIAIRSEDSCGVIAEMIDEENTKTRVVALAGNPNVGKSTVFNGLTGMKQHTGNWPGKTVSSARGYCRSGRHRIELVDIPGTYSLLAHSQEEEVARDFLKSGEAEAAIVICDATCLERNLNLALQIMEICPKVLLCVNLLDEAKKRGIEIDLNLISQRMGIPVVGVTARKKATLAALTEALDDVLDNVPMERSDESLGIKSRRMIEEDKELSRREKEDKTVASLVGTAERICEGAVTYSEEHDSRDRRLDAVFTGRLWGYPVMLVMLALIFWITIVGANYPSELLAAGFSGLQIKLTEMFTALGAPMWLHDMLVLGVYRVLAWVVSVMLPPMAIFFPLFTILEDAGYLPRIAYNMDKAFKCCGACGKQALTTCMGFGCNAVGVMGCRIIDSPRERLLAMLTNNFVPCNGRFSALIAIISMFLVGTGCADGEFSASLKAAAILTLIIAGGIGTALAVTGLLSKTLLRGIPSSFTLELPPYRCPQFGRVIIRSVLDRTVFVLARAAAAAAPAGLIVWILANTFIGDASILSKMVDFMEPIGNFMGLDGAILTAFILGLPANEIVIPITIMIYTSQGSLSDLGSLAEMQQLFAENGWTIVTAICTMIFYLMHWPCATTLLTIKKETGSIKWTLLAALIPTICGFILCSGVAGFGGLFI